LSADPPQLGVIGLGRMAQALLQPLLEDGSLRCQDVQAAVASEASAQRLSASLGIAVGTDPAPAWRAPVVLLAVKPQQLERAASAAPPAGPGERPLLISVLAGVTLARLERLFPGWALVRAVPNTPCLVRAGITGLSWGGGLSAETRQRTLRMFERVGVVKELPEALLDAFLALASSGPAMAAVLIEALADGGVAAGLPRPLAQDLTLAMLSGSTALLRERDLHPAQLKDMVASPAGTTIAALRRMERAGVRSALIEAVLAAAERSRELG
jgi:pyrroline-5-carboxylate reductase